MKQEQWSSQFGFIAAAVGSAVGLGNIWRFPYLTGISGGGAFLIAYFTALAVCALPVLMLEIAAGRRSGMGIVGTFRQLHPSGVYPGAFIAILSVALLSYYLVVTGWALGYLAYGLAGQHPQFAGFSAGWNSVIFFLLALALTVAPVYRGVQGGIEAMSKVLMPLLFLILLALAIYGVFLPGWGQAVTFYLAPDFSALLDGGIWVRAFGQVFFSLSVGMGVMITYGAYLPQGKPIARSSLIITVADTTAALLAGLVIFPIVFSSGAAPSAGPQLAFDAMPRAFEQFAGVTGYGMAVLFYALLSIAALTSAVAMLETAQRSVSELLGVGRWPALAGLTLVTALAGLPSALSYTGVQLTVSGQPIFDLMDHFVGTIGLSFGVLITAVVLGWLGRRLQLEDDIGKGFVGWSCLLLVRYAAPVGISITLFGAIFA